MNKSSVRSIIGCFGAAVLLTGTLTGCAGVSDVFYTLLTDQSETYSYEEQQFEEHEEVTAPDELSASSGDGKSEVGEGSVPAHEQEAVDRFGYPVTPAEDLSGFAYDQLDEDTKSAYSYLCAGIKEKKSSFPIRAKNTEAIKKAISAILIDHPEFFWLDGSAEMTGFETVGIWKVTLGFNVGEEEIDGISGTIEEKAEEYLATLSEEDGEYEKVRKAYEYIILNTDYLRESPQNQNIQSVFVNGYSVCAGYARAMKYLLDRAGVWCAYVEGTIADTGEGHAWNLVRIDGIYTYVDPSWGDPTYGEDDTDSGRLNIIYDYLCLTTHEMDRARHIPESTYTLPECTDRSYDWYALNGFYYDSYDPDALSSALWHAVDENESLVYFKFADFETYAQAMAALFPESGDGSLLEAPLQQRMEWDGTGSMQYFYSYSDELMIIKLYW